jgi:hypothetical protein
VFHADRNILRVLRRKALAKHAVRSEAENRIQAMISLAKSEVPVMPAELDPGAAHRMEEARKRIEDLEQAVMQVGYARRGVRSPAEAAASRHLSSVGEVA